MLQQIPRTYELLNISLYYLLHVLIVCVSMFIHMSCVKSGVLLCYSTSAQGHCMEGFGVQSFLEERISVK